VDARFVPLSPLFSRRGLFHMPMPQMFREEDNLAGQLYRSFTTRCYDLSCRWGLSGLASSLEDLFTLW